MTIQTDIPPAPSVAPALALARPLFGPGIGVAATDPRSDRHRALPVEAAGLRRAAPQRRHAFAAGRAAVHQAMRALDIDVRPVLIGADRAPVWPDGLTGSISHSTTACLAAVTHTTTARLLGLDVEEDTPLDANLVPIICTRSERAWLSGLPAPLAGQMAKLIFSAKECAYKCQYGQSRTLFGFDTFEITPDPDTGQFEATFVETVPGFAAGTRLAGRFAIGDGLIVTAMTLPA